MDQHRFGSISFEDAFAITHQRYKETADEVSVLRRELRDRDARLQTVLGEQCALKLQHRELTGALRKVKDALSFLLQEDPSLLDRLTSMPAPSGKIQSVDGAAAVLSGLQLCHMDPTQAVASNKKNYIARLPFEMRGDILLNLDRFSLDRAGFACPQFRAVVGCLVGASLRLLTSVHLNVRKPDSDEWGFTNTGRVNRLAERTGAQHEQRAPMSAAGEPYEFSISASYKLDPMELKCNSTGGNVNRQWSFPDAASATSHFINVVRHASVQDMSLRGALPMHLLEILSSTDVDVTVESLNVSDLLLTPEHLALGRSALTSFNSLHELTLGNAVPLSFVTEEFLFSLKNAGVAKFEFRSKLFTVRDGDDWAFHGGHRTRRSTTTARLPAARVPKDFCKRILETAISNGSHNPLRLSFVAAIDDLIVRLEGFEEFAQDLHNEIIVYKLPQSAASDMLVELKIITLVGHLNNWKLVEFRRFKKPAPRNAGDDWGGGGGDGFGNGGFGGGGWGGGGGDGFGNGGFGGGGWGGGNDQWG
ncbi:hypothetical protein AAVH_20766 [Aphelenchoides avenae]|nr:hypothetical protein AAVH_20766 [Aphelenchus avenae]